MNPHIHRSHKTEVRNNPSWPDKWEGTDKGLIISWEVGRSLAIRKPDLAELAKNGELPILDWKGGVAKKLKKPVKYGCLNYLAMWQGLRGEDLDIDMSREVGIVCARTGQTIIYTADQSKYAEAEDE